MNELGNLSHCMVDSDAEALARARHMRRQTVLMSLFLETAVVAAMLIWPLVTLGVLPHRYLVTPLPPYRGGGGRDIAKSPHRPVTGRTPQLNFPQIVFPTPQAANHGFQRVEDAPPELGPGAGTAFGSGSGNGPGIPWGIPGDGPAVMAIQPPHPAASNPVRQRVSEGIMAGALIYRVEPKYPQIATAMGLSGAVRLRAVIATDGTIQNLEILSGSPILARAAKEAVSQWRYRPTLLNGEPVEVETYITVNFVLNR